MNAGDVVLIRMPQVAGLPSKLRPALVLTNLPGPYQSVLICGISTQLQELQSDWDEIIDARESEFGATGLHKTSAVRLSYLYAADVGEIAGVIGSVSAPRLRRILGHLIRVLQT